MYYDCESERVKITSHCKFDEGFNDLPIEYVPLGFQQLVRANRDEPIPEDNVHKMAMKYLYEHQQQQHEDFIQALNHIPQEFHSLPYHYWGTETFTIQSLSDEARDLLWHQRLIHCGQHTLKNLH